MSLQLRAQVNTQTFASIDCILSQPKSTLGSQSIPSRWIPPVARHIFLGRTTSSPMKGVRCQTLCTSLGGFNWGSIPIEISVDSSKALGAWLPARRSLLACYDPVGLSSPSQSACIGRTKRLVDYRQTLRVNVFRGEVAVLLSVTPGNIAEQRGSSKLWPRDGG